MTLHKSIKPSASLDEATDRCDAAYHRVETIMGEDRAIRLTDIALESLAESGRDPLSVESLDRMAAFYGECIAIFTARDEGPPSDEATTCPHCGNRFVYAPHSACPHCKRPVSS